MIGISESSRISAYLSTVPDKATPNLQENGINAACRISPLPSPPLSDEEKEQQLDAVDNGVKTVDVLNRKEKPKSASEQIGVSNGGDERLRFIEKLYNLPFGEYMKYMEPNRLDNGVIFDSGLDLTTAEAPESTPENPVMYVTSGYNAHAPEGTLLTWYKVYVNQVDPHSATREEMMALITYEYRDAGDEAMAKATYAWTGADGFVEEEDGGRADWMAALQANCAWSEKFYKSGDMRHKNTYEALLEIIDTLNKRAENTEQPTKPLQTTTIYHKIAAEKVKTEAEVKVQ